jgi:uncharacterized protein YjbJ (UPF0337 family)
MEPARLGAQNNQDSHSLFLEAPMKNSTKDQAEGTLHEVKGKVKEQIGKTTNNPRLQDEGTDEKVAVKGPKESRSDREGFRQLAFATRTSPPKVARYFRRATSGARPFVNPGHESPRVFALQCVRATRSFTHRRIRQTQ